MEYRVTKYSHLNKRKSTLKADRCSGHKIKYKDRGVVICKRNRPVKMPRRKYQSWSQMNNACEKGFAENLSFFVAPHCCFRRARDFQVCPTGRRSADTLSVREKWRLTCELSSVNRHQLFKIDAYCSVTNFIFNRRIPSRACFELFLDSSARIKHLSPTVQQRAK